MFLMFNCSGACLKNKELKIRKLSMSGDKKRKTFNKNIDGLTIGENLEKRIAFDGKRCFLKNVESLLL